MCWWVTGTNFSHILLLHRFRVTRWSILENIFSNESDADGANSKRVDSAKTISRDRILKRQVKENERKIS